MTEEEESSAGPVKEQPRGEGGGKTPPPDSEKSPCPELDSDAATAARGGGDETTPATNSDGTSFSQPLAGTTASPSGSPRPPAILTVPVVAVPCFLAPTALIESPGFTGHFAITHQAALATVTAPAQVQMHAAYPSSSETETNRFPHPTLPTVGHMQPLQQISPVTETYSGDVYHWRKYGQKQVKNTENSCSYYRCANPSCLAKKKVERCPDGKIHEVICRGKHDHDPPQKNQYTRDRGAQSSGSSKESESSENPSSEPIVLGPSDCKTEDYSGTKPQLYPSSDCEGDAEITTKIDLAEEPDPKKRRLCESSKSSTMPVPKPVREYVVQTEIDTRHLSDGYRWRKYGQKFVKGNPNPRSTHEGCPVRKHVERASHDAKALVITYEGKHNHDQPMPKYASDQTASDSSVATDTSAPATGKEPDASSSLPDKISAEVLNPSNIAKKLAGDEATEFGDGKAPACAQSLARIKEGCDRTDADGLRKPRLIQNPAAVPVKNS